MKSPTSNAVWTEARQLTFRALLPSDVEAVHRLHSDPTTNQHNPCGSSSTLAATGATLGEWLEHRRRHGYGHELAFVGDQLAGIGGARSDVWLGDPVVNLHWRLMPAFHGLGLAGSIGRRALQIAEAAQTGHLIVARMRPQNEASARVAVNLGLHRRADLDGTHDDVEWIIHASSAAIDGHAPSSVAIEA